LESVKYFFSLVFDQGSRKDNRLPCGASLSSKVLHKARLRLDQQNTKDAPPRRKAALFAAIGERSHAFCFVFAFFVVIPQGSPF
jgi:hypothetical protein